MALRLALVALLGLAALGVGMIATVALAPEPVRPAEAQAAEPVAPRRTPVLVAARPVQAGTLLKPEDITMAEIPVEDVPEGALHDAPGLRADLPGAMARRALQPGDPLRAEALLRPGESGFLAAVLTPGLRAVTVGVDMITGAAGLIWPGDRVDLILTQQLEDHTLPAARRHLGEVVLEAARVIAVDRHFVQGAQPGSGELMRDPQRTVTLEVTAEQSTRVALAGRMGRLSLALRAAGTPPAASGAGEAATSSAPQRPVWGGDVSPALLRDPAQSPAPVSVMRVIQGPERAEEIRFR
jgi:pilus assembly protein CpaB